MQNSHKQLDVSTNVIIKVVVTLLVLGFLYVIRDILLLLFVAIVLTAAMDPVIVWFYKKKIPRIVTISFLYILFISFVGVIVSFIAPSFVHEQAGLAREIPNLLEKVTGMPQVAENTEQIIKDISGNVTKQFGSIFSGAIGIFSIFVSIIAILVMAFYMSLTEDGMKRFLISITPKIYKSTVIRITEKIKDRIGWWMAGQLLLMFIIFVLYYIVLSLLGVPYAFALALLGGAFEIIPYIGPIISVIPAALLGLTISPTTSLLVMTSYIIIQQLENHIIIPQIMKKAVGLNPVVIIVALLIGVKLAGIPGIILAVPVVAAINVVIEDILEKNIEDMA